MKRIATVMALTLAVAAFGKFSPVGKHRPQVIADEGDGGDDGGSDDGGGDEHAT